MLHTVIGIIAGLIVGLASLAALEWLVGCWLAGVSSPRVLACQGLRLILTVAGFAGIAQLGAGALLGALGGYTLARARLVPEVSRWSTTR